MKGVQRITQLLLVIGIIIFLNVIANFFFGAIDLTEEKRYTLSPSTHKVVESLDDNLFVKILLDGELPPGFKRLQNSTKELLNELQDINPDIQYIFEDPMEGSVQEIKDRRDQLAKDGVIGVTLTVNEGNGVSQKAIYPFALISYKGRTSKISLLKEQNIGEDDQVVLNRSIELLEYKFANQIQKLTLSRRQNIAFSTGHGELPFERTIRLQRELENFYNVGRLNLDSLVVIDKELDLLIVPAPKESFDDKAKFKLDQYIMNGGKVIWLIEKMDTHLDSINKYRFYVPNDIITGLDGLLFKYGAKIQPNLVLDLEATAIPQVVGQQDGKPQTMLFKWFYHPLAIANRNHPIGKNLDRVNMYFPSSLDTVKTKYPVTKTPILSTSPYSRYQLNPVRLNFEILKYPVEEDQFNKGNQTLGLLLEGEFESAYANRITPGFQATLDQLNIKFQPKSIPTKQIVISDVDFMKNRINLRTNTADPIGYNVWEQKVYDGNRDFILNAIEYLLDESGVLDSRSKEVKLRLLDAVKTKQERNKWQFINIGLPLVFLGLFGILFNYIRKRKYSR
ncbi:MAG: gliding motility-associated ABC transporter substrate-binding protein GldG [Saprospiraceae bacterium]|nr:gliding motility-associated ABC transporter substrate-binding protein GldG [Saprospiraceae bacterium]